MQSNLNRQPSLRNPSEKSSAQFNNFQIGDAGLALIRRFEGLVLHPYLCPAGFWTIGFGHRIDPSEVQACQGGVHCTQAEDWLRVDAEYAFRAACRLTRRVLEPHEADALASFVFNLGAAAYQRSTLRLAIERREADETARQWRRWVWAGGRPMPGLAARRAAELNLCLSDLFQTGQRRNGSIRP